MKGKKIVVKNISKTFEIGFKKNQSFLAKMLSSFSGREPKKKLKALRDISFEVKEGEVLGIIGENGSGKSTLLRILAGIYKKDTGEVYTYGKIISLIGLGAGLQERLTAKENIFLVGPLFDLSSKATKKKFNSIVTFAGLDEFVNTKVYQFSEGMKQRLAFSIAIHANPRILLLDEVFEVGDEKFRKKSSQKILELVKKGVFVILVTHSVEMVKEYCDRVLWMSKGKIIRSGEAKKVVKEYLKATS